MTISSSGSECAEPDQDEQRDRAYQPRDQEEDEGRRDLPGRQLGPHAGDGEAEVRGGARVGQEEVPEYVEAGGDGRTEGKGGGLEEDGAEDSKINLQKNLDGTLPQHSPESSLMLTGVPVKKSPTKYMRSAGLELPSDPIGCSPRGSAMKRPLYYLLCAIACTSMVGATMPMAAIAEAIQPQETAEQTQADAATSSNTGRAEDGTNTNATADTVEDSPATSTDTSAVNTESADGTPTTPGTTTATGATTPSLRAQAVPTPEAISATSQTTYAHSATASQNGVTFTVSWNDAPAGSATTFHVTQANGSSQAKARMDVPTYWDGGSQESVCDPSRAAWASYHSLGTAGHDFTFEFTASGAYRIYFYFMDNDRNDPQNDKGIYYLRTTAEVTINDAARPSVTQIVNNTVAQCRQQTNGSEYDMALWLHDWTLDQLEYDHSLNWCSAESGLTRHQGTCESYQRIYSKLLNAAGIANGRITGNGHTWNAVKIDGKWCQMDLTWDDTSDNWYGDLDQRHLYFGLTDELMAIAHSDHTANYQKEDYAYRSTDLSNNYFVRNGKADEWAAKYADRIQQHLDAKEESFSIDADNQSFPPSISGIQNGIVAYAMNRREWKTGKSNAAIQVVSNFKTCSSTSWEVTFDFTVKYANEKRTVGQSRQTARFSI